MVNEPIPEFNSLSHIPRFRTLSTTQQVYSYICIAITIGMQSNRLWVYMNCQCCSIVFPKIFRGGFPPPWAQMEAGCFQIPPPIVAEGGKASKSTKLSRGIAQRKLGNCIPGLDMSGVTPICSNECVSHDFPNVFSSGVFVTNFYFLVIKCKIIKLLYLLVLYLRFI